jgi:Fe2+ or Zn2+ uptake regulation protein
LLGDNLLPIDVSIPPAEQRGFAIGSTEVIFRGLCADCHTDCHTD